MLRGIIQRNATISAVKVSLIGCTRRNDNKKDTLITVFRLNSHRSSKFHPSSKFRVPSIFNTVNVNFILNLPFVSEYFVVWKSVKTFIQEFSYY